jgi:hypothetical protein
MAGNQEDTVFHYPEDSRGRLKGQDIDGIKNILNSQISTLADSRGGLIEAAVSIFAKSIEIGELTYYIQIQSKDLTSNDIYYLAAATSWSSLFFINQVANDHIDVEDIGDNAYRIIWTVYDNTHSEP